MTLNVHARLTFDGAQAKAGMQDAATEARGMGEAIEGAGTKVRKADGDFEALRRELQGYKADLTALRGEHSAAIGQIGRMEAEIEKLRGTTTKVPKVYDNSSASIANMTAQFNDIGVMLAAGQNPLQLAIQQGTQIGQVFQASGAKGRDALKLILNGLTSMISPVNLVTIGVIAMGGALVNWLSRGEEETVDLIDRLEEAREKTAELERERAVWESGAGDETRFAYLEEIAAAERTVRQLEGRIANAPRHVAENAKLELAAAREAADLARDALARHDDGLQLDQKRAAFKELQEGWTAATARVREYITARLDEENALRTTLDTMNDKLAVAQAEVAYGEDSRQAIEARIDAERRALEETLATSDASALMKDEVRAAFEAMADFQRAAANADLSGLSGQAAALAGMMGFAADEAERFNAALNQSAGLPDVTPKKAGLSFGLPGVDQGQLGVGFENLGFGDLDDLPPRSRGPDLSSPPPKKTRGGGRSRGKKAAREERDAVAELIAQYQQELDILRTADPVQQELIRHRKELAKASDAERAQLTGLITSIEQEEQAKRRAAETSDYFRNSMADLVPDLVRGGDSAASAWERMARSLEDAAWQALLLGEGPLMGLFGMLGGGGTGAAAGGLFGWIGKLFGLAEGGDPFSPEGQVYGLGGPKADKRLVKVSAGEFIMNAKATQKHRAQLEAMNAGATLPGFARGGAVDGSRGGWGAPGVTVQFVNQSRRGLQMEESETRTAPDGSRVHRFVVADAVAEGLSTRGGRARQTLTGEFGVRPRRQPR